MITTSFRLATNAAAQVDGVRGICATALRLKSVMLLTAIGVIVGLGAGCSGTDRAPSGSAQASGSGNSLQGSVTVLAASSLTTVFTAIGTRFEALHPGVRVQFSFGASSTLADQVLAGSPVDVVATANSTTMDKVVAAGETALPPSMFATNSMQLAVPATNPGNVSRIDDLSNPKLAVGACATRVPCGDITATIFKNASITPSIDSFEPDVRALLTKIEADELDAGIVYQSDVVAAGSAVIGIDIPDAINETTDYPIAITRSSENSTIASEFVRFVLSDEGQRILQKGGFGPPGED